MTKTTIHRAALAIVFVLIFGGGGAVVSMALSGGGVLDGETHHDFGVVKISDVGARVEHTFRLTNRTGEVVEIGRIKTSCGCLASNPSTSTVEPGATVEISTAMLIKASVRKNASLTLELGEHGIQTLTVEALGRRAEPLFARRPTLEIEPGGVASMNVYLEREGSSPPPGEVRITTPDGIEATLGDWSQSRAANAASEHPSIWLAPLEVRQASSSLPAGAAVTISLDEDLVVIVPLEAAGATAADDAPDPAP